jgi:D-3-phosphoglycerate dehydrogenase
MKVLVSDSFSSQGLEIFKQATGLEIEYKTGMAPEELKSVIGDYDGLVVRSATKVTSDIIEGAKNLKAIGRAGVGVDNIDVAAATKKGIVVMNTPGGNAMAAAEHTIALMFAICRNIPQAVASMREKRWEKKAFMGVEVFGKTLGVIGLGNIGSIVADRALGLKMNVLIHDPYISPDLAKKKGYELVSLEQLLACSDIITVHVPRTPETEDMIDADAINKMKDGVMIINCARGGIVNEAALAEACTHGKIAKAAVDVFSKEPATPDNPVLDVPNIICTPHLGASTEEAQENVAIAIARQMVEYLTAGTIRNAINVPSVDATVLKTLGPYVILGQGLGGFFARTCPFPLKELVIEYQGDVAKQEVAPISSSVLAGLFSYYMEDEMVNEVNAPFIARERGIQVREAKVSEEAEFTSLITLTAKSNGEHHSLAGSIFGKGEPRLVRVNEYSVEAIPKGNIIMVENLDKPGVIGSIGSVLGEREINITSMHWGREKVGGRALGIVHLDSLPAPEVIDDLKNIPNVYSIKCFQL